MWWCPSDGGFGCRWELIAIDIRGAVDHRILELSQKKYSCDIELDAEGEEMLTVHYQDGEGDTVVLDDTSFAHWRQGDRASGRVNIEVRVKMTEAARRRYLSKEQSAVCSSFVTVTSSHPHLRRMSVTHCIVLHIT